MRRGTVLLVVGAVLLAGCGRGGDSGYSADTRASFLEPCISGLGAGDRDVCECSYARITEEIPFETFEAIDRELQDDPDAELPDEVADIVVACAADPEGAADPEDETTTTPLP
jgi:hypothetical protein